MFFLVSILDLQDDIFLSVLGLRPGNALQTKSMIHGKTAHELFVFGSEVCR